MAENQNSLSVLVADAEAATRHQLAADLRAAGIGVREANTLDEIESQIHSPGADVVICPIRMHGFDGLEFCRRLRGSPASVSTYVILTSTDPIDAARAFAAGADDHLPLPCDRDSLVNRVLAAHRIQPLRGVYREQARRLHQANTEMTFMRERLDRLARELEQAHPLGLQTRSHSSSSASNRSDQTIESTLDDCRDLLESVNRTLDSARVGGGAPAGTIACKTGEPGEAEFILPCNILFLGEDTEMQYAVTWMLREARGRVALASSEKAAIGMLRAAEERNQPYDAVVVDLDGEPADEKELIRSLRDSGFRRPILAMSQVTDAGDRVRRITLGFDDCAVKPMNRRRFIQWIRSHLATGQTTRRRNAGLLTDEPVSEAEFQNRLHDFVEELPRQAAHLRDALQAGDLSTLSRLAQTLRGSAEGYGFHTITNAAGELERNANAVSDMTEIEEQVRRLCEFCERARATTPSP